MFTIPNSTEINADDVMRAIEHNEKHRSDYSRLLSYYEGDHDILYRQKTTGLKNNKVLVNHSRYITDLNVGLMLGNPIEYQAFDKTKNQSIDIDPIIEEYKKQSIHKVDLELGKRASKVGVAYEYNYVNKVGNQVTKEIDPRNAIVVYDDTLDHEPMWGIIYSTTNKDITKPASNKATYTGIIATSTTIYDFSLKGKVLTILQERPHKFGMVPVIEYVNNESRKGDYTDVLLLIDAYNLLQSDRVNDKEQLVEALLILYGIDLTTALLDQLKVHRVMTAPSKNDGVGAEYLTKSLNEQDADTLRKVLEQDIHKISMTPNMSDQNFVGNASGVALRYKLIPLEQNLANKETYFKEGLMRRFQMYVNYKVFRKHMKDIPTYLIEAVFKRNLPQNDYETSQMIVNLQDIVPHETLISQLSYIEDASKEIEAKTQETLDRANLGSEMFGTGNESENVNTVEAQTQANITE